jgi:hypothetical protein
MQEFCINGKVNCSVLKSIISSNVSIVIEKVFIDSKEHDFILSIKAYSTPSAVRHSKPWLLLRDVATRCI